MDLELLCWCITRCPCVLRCRNDLHCITCSFHRIFIKRYPQSANNLVSLFHVPGLIEGRPATAFPAFCDKLTNKERVEDRVVKTDNLITSRGPGTAMEFALQLVAALHGLDKAREVAKATVPFEGWDKYIK